MSNNLFYWFLKLRFIWKMFYLVEGIKTDSPKYSEMVIFLLFLFFYKMNRAQLLVQSADLDKNQNF